MLGIKTEYTEDGVYINTSREEGISIIGNLKFDVKKGANRIFIKANKAIEQYEKKWSNREIYGGKLCPSKYEHLLVKTSSVCPPITNKMILKFLSKSLGDQWILVDKGSSRTLLSPENTRTKEGLMSGIMKAVIAMGGPKPIAVSEQKYILAFYKFDNQVTVEIDTNFEIIDGNNWVELNQEDVIPVENANIHLSKDWYKHRLVEINDKKREKLLSANEATLNLVKLSSEGKPFTVRHNISLKGFKEAYEAFVGNSVY